MADRRTIEVVPRSGTAESGFGFSGDGRFAGSLSERLFDRAPGEHGGFDALGEFADALGELEVVERGGRRLRGPAATELTALADSRANRYRRHISRDRS